MSEKQKYLNLLGNLVFAPLFVLVIVYLNFLAIRYFFLGEFNQNIASIEISYVQMAKFWAEGKSLWQSLWYLGYPWHVFYTPLLPLLELTLHNFFHLTFAHAYRVIVSTAYILVPISLFFFAWQAAKSKMGAFIAAICYSILPSVIALLFKGVAEDTLTGNWEPRRFAILVRWGEGPHTLALVFLPLFGIFLLRYFEGRKRTDLIAAAFFLALCALTNAIVVWAAILLVGALFLASSFSKNGNIIADIKSVFAVLIFAFGLSAFWYNIPFLSTFFREGGGSLNNWLSLFPWGLLPILLGVSMVVFAVLKITRGMRHIAFVIFWFLILFALIYVYYASGEDQLELVPQVLRMTTEVDMALSLLLGVLFSELFLLMWKFKRFKYVMKSLVLILFILLCSSLILWKLPQLKEMGKFTKPKSEADLKQSAEYRVAKKLESMNDGSGERVAAPGNYGFWLNYFTDVPQLRGALYQSATNFWPEHIYYQLVNGKSAEIALSWLKIANVGKLVYTTAGSAETYKDYKVDRQKFDSIGSVISEDGGDIFYKIPLKNSSPAKIIDTENLGKLKKPYNAIDEKNIFNYVSFLEEKSAEKLDVKRVSAAKWTIRGNLKDKEGILLQETYDPGWQVVDKTARWKKIKDPMDFMVFVPNRSGEFNLEIVYRKPLTVYLGYLISAFFVILVVSLPLINRMRARNFSVRAEKTPDSYRP